MDTNTKTVEDGNKTEETKIDMSKVSKVADYQQGLAQAKHSIDKLEKDKNKLTACLSGDSDFLDERLAQYATVEELTKAVNTEEQVREFFTNPDGHVLTLIAENGKTISEDEDFEFKKGLLVYLKQTEISQKELSEMCENFEKETKEITDELGTTIRDFCSSYMDELVALRKSIPDTEENKEALKELDFIDSGFNFSKMLETFDKHPTIPQATVNNMRTPEMVIGIGKKYRTTLKNAKVTASLISFVSNSEETSFEEMYLPRDKYKAGYENLFVFSLIRFFTKEYWSANVKKMHASTILNLQRFINDDMPEEMKTQYIENIATYLSRFYTEEE